MKQKILFRLDHCNAESGSLITNTTSSAEPSNSLASTSTVDPSFLPQKSPASLVGPESQTSSFLSKRLRTPLPSRPAQAAFDQLGEIPCVEGKQATKRAKINGTYIIYTIDTLPDLIQKLQSKAQSDALKKNLPPSEIKFFKIRYLVSETFQLLFAEEGSGNNASIPAHFKMTGAPSQSAAQCICAGNLKINAELVTKKINHKSGDFSPPYETLQWALGILFANNMQFLDELVIEKVSPDGGTHERFSVTTADLKELLMARFSKERIQEFIAANSEPGTKTYVYKAERSRGSGFFDHSPNNRSNFEDPAPCLPPNILLREAIQRSQSSEMNRILHGPPSTPTKVQALVDEIVTPPKTSP